MKKAPYMSQHHAIISHDAEHCGPEPPRILTEVLGHSLVRSIVCSHRSLICLLRTTRFARALRCAHSWVSEWLDGYLFCVLFYSGPQYDAEARARWREMLVWMTNTFTWSYLQSKCDKQIIKRRIKIGRVSENVIVYPSSWQRYILTASLFYSSVQHVFLRAPSERERESISIVALSAFGFSLLCLEFHRPPFLFFLLFKRVS